MITSLTTRPYRLPENVGELQLPKCATPSVLHTIKESRPNIDLVDDLDFLDHSLRDLLLCEPIIVIQARDVGCIRVDEYIEECDLEHDQAQAGLRSFERLGEAVIAGALFQNLQLRRFLQHPTYIADDRFLEERSVEMLPRNRFTVDGRMGEDEGDEDDQFAKIGYECFRARGRVAHEASESGSGVQENLRRRAA